MIPVRLVLILHDFILSMPQLLARVPVFLRNLSFAVRKQVVSACVNLMSDPGGGSGPNMTRIHVHSSNISNPDPPPFPSQLFVYCGSLAKGLI